MALSCVYRTGQRFGAAYVIDVLLGHERDRILHNRHHELSTFGIGELDANEWRSLFRQLLARGYLISDERHGGLSLSPTSKPLLAGKERLELRRFDKRKHAAKPAKVAAPADLAAADVPLFEALRERRRAWAEQQGVPPYVILHDKTLRAICAERPRSRDALAQIPGIGASKLERYGDALLEIVRGDPSTSPEPEIEAID